MLGALPLKALYHQQMMQHYGAICLLPKKNKLAQLARRQLTAGDVSPNSWFEEIKRVADIYDIDVCINMLNPVNTTRWTTHTSKSIAEYHNTTMQNKAYSMDTLKWIIWSNKWQGKQRKSRAHPTWQVCRGAPYRVAGASVRMKMFMHNKYSHYHPHCTILPLPVYYYYHCRAINSHCKAINSTTTHNCMVVVLLIALQWLFIE